MLFEHSNFFIKYIHLFSTFFQNYCGTNWDISLQAWKENQYPKADKERMETQCFKSAWVAVAIHEGFHFQDQYFQMFQLNQQCLG